MRLLALALALAPAVQAQDALPFAVGGPYALTDHHGQARTEADPQGHPQLMFFGYANCPGICSAALPLMADVTDEMAARGVTLRPVMITVDPARDTVENMGPALTAIHSDFIGLTGDQASLNAAYKSFNVQHELAYEDPDYGPVYSHGSLIYLMDAKGGVLTVLPPVLDSARASEIAWTYLRPASDS